MRTLTTLTATALLLASSAAAIADGTPSTKDTPAPATPPFDIAFGGGVASDYVFRGISQSARWPSATAYTELRYTVRPDWVLYAGLSGESIDYPNRAAAEIDFYGGVRPTFGKLALDVGFWYYWYPGGRLYDGAPIDGQVPPYPNPNCTNGFTTPTGYCNVLRSGFELLGGSTARARTASPMLWLSARTCSTRRPG